MIPGRRLSEKNRRINSLEQLENTEIIRTKLRNDKKDEHGPFDIIGDIHGCCVWVNWDMSGAKTAGPMGHTGMDLLTIGMRLN